MGLYFLAGELHVLRVIIFWGAGDLWERGCRDRGGGVRGPAGGRPARAGRRRGSRKGGSEGWWIVAL